MGEPRRVTDSFAVTSQPSRDEIRHYAALGYRTLINNRPDGEDAGQMTAAEARAEAERAGLDYVHVPVPLGGITRADVEAFARALESRPQPVIAHCRSGLRSLLLWGAAEALSGRRDAQDIVREGEALGYDLSRLPELVARLR